MIRTAICDDEEKTRAYLSALIRKQPCPCDIIEYSSADDCLTDHRQIDLLFLDIDLGPSGPDGISLAQRLRQQGRSPRPVIIFVTGYERYVFDAFDVDAFQYLLKPVDEEKFARVFARAAEQAAKAQTDTHNIRSLTLRSSNNVRTIFLHDIYYIESSNHKVTLHLQDGEFTCYAKIRDLETELGESFFRIHKGYLVNLSYIKGYSKTEAFLTNGTKILISKYKYQDFVKAYLHFLKKEAGYE